MTRAALLLTILSLSLATREAAAIGDPVSVPEFCSQIGAQSVRDNYTYWPSMARLLKSGSAQDIFAELWYSGRELRYVDQWVLLFHPRLEVKKAAQEWAMWQSTHYLFERAGTPEAKVFSDITYRDWIHAFLVGRRSKPSSYSRSLQDVLSTRFDTLNLVGPLKGIDQLKDLAFPLFMLYGELSGSWALREVADRMDPRSWGGLVLATRPAFREVLGDDSYVQPLVRTAIRLLEASEAAERGNLPRSSLWDDLLSSFLESGVSYEEARRRTWNIMAMFGARGPSIAGLFSLGTGENSVLWVALNVIFSSTTYLDGFLVADGRSYSYPSFVRTQCSYGGEYHFWMSAYLSHVTSRNAGERSAVLASYLAGMIYEFGSATFGRTPTAPLFPKTDPSYANALRRNLAFDLAGAISGIALDRLSLGIPSPLSEIDIDEGISRLVEAAQPPYNLPEKDIKKAIENPQLRYCWWRRQIRPELFVSDWALKYLALPLSISAGTEHDVYCWFYPKPSSAKEEPYRGPRVSPWAEGEEP